jgi:DUF4097 and DUF4098 domain-containing protein YvlB
MNALRFRPARRGFLLLALLCAGTAVVGGATLPAPLAAQASRQKPKPKPQSERDRERERRHDDDDDDERSARIDTTVTVGANAVVYFALNGGEVVVRAWDRNEVRVSAELEGGRLDFEASPTRVAIGDAHGSSGDARFEVTVPRTARVAIEGTNAEIAITGVKGGVEIDNANGDVRLVDVGGLVKAELMTGELHISGGDGEFRCELASGDVVVEDVSGRIQVETVSGDIVVRRARARELRLETTSGSVSYDGSVQGDGQYEMSTHSGDVRLRLPEGTRARLEAETYNGEFTSDFAVTMTPAAGSSIRQRKYQLLVGDGQGPLIRLASFNGDIHLGRASVARADSTRNDR